MIAFVDTPVLMYASGPDHPLRTPSADVLAAIARSSANAVSSSEVLQEILHLGIRRQQLDRARSAISDFYRMLGEQIVPVLAADVVEAASRSFATSLSARDRLHLAVMRRHGVTAIITADRGFDLVPGIRRLNPGDFAAWRDELFG